MIRIIANDGIDSLAKTGLIELGYDVDTNHYEGEDLEREILECEVIIIRSATKIRKDLIDVALTGKLKLIIRAGVGIDNIDHEYAREKGLAVRNTPNASSQSVAEIAIGHMFSLARNIGISNVTMRDGQWNKKQYKGVELSGKTLGLIGFGRIAKYVAQKASALGMNVQYYKRSGEDEDYTDYNYVDLQTLITTSDFVSLHIPFTKGSTPILSKEDLLSMKENAFIINTARGGVFNEADLLEVLNEGHLGGAAIDVYEKEPTANIELCNHPRVSVTPHIGASTKEAQKRIGDETIAVIKEFYASRLSHVFE